MTRELNQEIEWQFETDDLRRTRQFVLKFIKTLPYQCTVRKPITQVDTYFDTKDLTYYQAHFSLRIRKAKRAHEATLKSISETNNNGALTSRVEFSHALPGAVTKHLLDLPGEMGALIRSKHPKTRILKLFTLKTQRERIEIAAGSGLIAEIALDKTALINGHTMKGPFLSRIEVEIKDHAFAPTIAIVVKRLRKFLLEQGVVIKPAKASKFMTAFVHYRLVAPEKNFGAYDFSKKMTLERYVLAVFRKYLSNAFRLESGCRIAFEPEFVHQMRVSLRRVLSAMKTLSDYVPKAIADHRPFLRTVILALGEVRDLDVQIDYLKQRHELSAHGDKRPFLELMDHLDKKRKEAHKNLLKVFNSKMYSKSLRSLVDTVSNPAIITTETDSAGHAYHELIKAPLRDFQKLAKKLVSDAKPKRFHRARIKGKELRYTLEFFKPLAEKSISHLIEVMSTIQDELGAINDYRVASERIFEMAHKKGEQFSPEAHFVMGQACMHYHDLERDCRTKFVDNFQALKWERLTKTI